MTRLLHSQARGERRSLAEHEADLRRAMSSLVAAKEVRDAPSAEILTDVYEHNS